MKKFSKGTAIGLSIVMFVVAVIGFIFSFVPIKFSKYEFLSLSKTMNISTDLVGGMYGEYDILTENPTENDIIESVAIIREVFEDDGYKNVSVYAQGKDKVRVELSYPTGGDDSFQTTYSKLSNVGAGKFKLASAQTIDDTTVVLDGAKYVKDVKVFTNNSNKYISVEFTKAGESKFEELCNTTTSIYLFLGDYSQSITVSGVTDFSALTLSNTDWENMISLEQKIRLGCTKIELDGTNAKINTMSATLSSGESSPSPVDKSFFLSTTFIVAISAFFIIVALSLAFFAVKFGFFAFIVFVSMLFNVYLFLFIAWLIPSFELGLSVVLTAAISMAFIYLFTFNYANEIKNEYNLGKSLAASLESSYKKAFSGVVITNVFALLSSVVLVLLSFSEISSVAVTFAIASALSLFTNLVFVPFLVKIAISFNGFGRKLFMLPKRKSLSELTDSSKEED